MPYLSRIWINPLRRRAQPLLTNPQALHAAVLGGLSHQPVDERVLWRLTTERHRAELLVLTESTPSWEHLVEQAGWPASDDPQAQVRDYQPLLDRVELERTFHFRLRVNPAASTRRPDKPSGGQQKKLAGERPRGVRVAQGSAAYQFEWMIKRIERWGFRPLDAVDGQPAMRLIGRERLVFRKRSDVSAGQVVVNTATFDGLVQVVDVAAARRSLLAGVGPAKGYGCGLITLAPAREAAT